MYPGEHCPHGVPLIKAGDLSGNVINPFPEFRISLEKHTEYRRTELEGGEILMTLVGEVGQCAVVPQNMAGWNTARAVAVIRLKDASDAHFVAYSLRSPAIQHIMDVWCNTTVQATLNLKEIKQLPLPWPPKPERDAIACILGALDDKIELNRRRNRTLEAMARAIFQSWFVDFDPVRAKAAGRKPAGLSKELAALFPDSFDDSALGPIPKGWRVGTIKENAVRIQYGLTTSAATVPVGPRFLRITDIQGGKVQWQTVPYCFASDSEQEKYRIADGDIFVARTGASTGENIYIVEPPEAVFASYLVRFQFAEASMARVVGEFMRTETYFAFVEAAIGGSAQPNASAQTLAGASLVFPPDDLARKFYDRIRPMDLKRVANDAESRTLAALRDALLPKLISGEVRVPDAERIAGRAT
jgi:type I restriction enzyme S subunit